MAKGLLEEQADKFLAEHDGPAAKKLAYPYLTENQWRKRNSAEIPVSNLGKTGRNDVTNQLYAGFDYED